MPYLILIVVDDSSLRQRCAEALAPAAPLDGAAYQVVTVSTVTNAIWYAARRRFDLVLIEAHPRGPLYALARLLVDQNPAVQMIAVGAQAAAMQRDTRPQPGPPVVAPDCTATELRAIVRSILSPRPTLAARWDGE